MCEINDSYRHACYWNREKCKNINSLETCEEAVGSRLCGVMGKCSIVSGSCINFAAVKTCADIKTNRTDDCSNVINGGYYKFCTLLFFINIYYFFF
jgi:hypothetical protein